MKTPVTTTHGLALMLALVAGACTPSTPPSIFGALCATSVECGSLMCRPDPAEGVRRCLPPRLPSEAGERCDSPLVAKPQSGTVVVDESVFFGGAVDDGDIVCGGGGQPDLVVAFTLTARDGDGPDALQGISVRADNGVAVALRGAGCGETLRFGCASAGETALLADVPPGDYELVVDGAPPGVGTVTELATRVVVERLDCPTGGLPFDAGRCLRVSEAPSLGTPRIHHTAHRLESGDIAVVGGASSLGPLATVEVFNATGNAWRYGDLATVRDGHGSGVIEGDVVVAVGGDPFNGGSISVVRTADIDAFVANASLVSVPGNSGFTSAIVGGGENDRLFVLSSSRNELGIFSPGGGVTRRRLCSNSTSCGGAGDGFVCAAIVPPPSAGQTGVCVCASDRCRGGAAVGREVLRDADSLGTYTPGTTMGVVKGRVAVVSGNTASAIITVDIRPSGGVVQYIEGGLPRHYAAVVAIDDRRVWVIGGEDDDGVALDVIEEVDLTFETVRVLPFQLSHPIARPVAAVLDGSAVVVADGSDLPDVIRFDGSRVRTPLLLPRDERVLVESDDEIFAIGGSVDGKPQATVQRLELVSTRAPAPPPIRCLALPLPADGVARGETKSADDTFRTERCDDYVFGFGRDRSFTFSVDAPSSVRIVDVNTDIPNPSGVDAYRFFLLRGDCEQHEEIACGDDDNPLALFVPEIEPGDYTLVIDYAGFESIFDDDVPHGGSAFSARVLLGPPMTCPADEQDPADDVVTGAVTMPYSDVSESHVDEGRLCPGDVDHRVVEHWGGSMRLNAVGVPFDDLVVQRAVVDEAASVAAGTIRVSAVTGPLVAANATLPFGHYVVTMASAAGSVDFVQWSLQQTYSGCQPDPDDSLIAGLDNRTPATAPVLSPGGSVKRTFCVASDVDLVVLEPGPGTDSSIVLDDTSVVAEFFTLNGDTIGAPITVTSAIDGFDRIFLLGTLAGPVAMRLTPPGTGEINVEVDVEYFQNQLGDSCRDPLPLSPGGARSGTTTGDAAGFNNNHDASLLGGCTGFRSQGPDTVLSVTLAAGETLAASIVGLDGSDIGVYVLDRCPAGLNDPQACVAGADQGGTGEADALSFTNTTGQSAVFFVVVDSFFVSAYTWRLTWGITGS